jgi:hypothetical protein
LRVSVVQRDLAADDGVGLDLYSPARIEEPSNDDKAGDRADLTKYLAMNRGHGCAVLRIDEEDARSDDIADCGIGFVQRLLDDLKASTTLSADFVVDVPVRPDRGRGGDEDLLAHSYSSAETDDGLQRGA